ncbi:hypothetical protein [Paenibacillus nasutitermitis]|uniref:hypothetical protein n=1 Tax=Paenibacillus nasutitermitis TaxID=1652958 RepID=UPI00166731CE
MRRNHDERWGCPNDGTYVCSWGGKGSEPGQLDCPHGICVDSHGDVYVAEWINYGRVTKLIRNR